MRIKAKTARNQSRRASKFLPNISKCLVMFINYRVEEKRGRISKGAVRAKPRVKTPAEKTRSVFFFFFRETERERRSWVSCGVCESVYGGGTTGI